MAFFTPFFDAHDSCSLFVFCCNLDEFKNSLVVKEFFTTSNDIGDEILSKFPRSIVDIDLITENNEPTAPCAVVDDVLNNSGSKFHCTPVFIKDI